MGDIDLPFDPLERRVIEIARHEPARSLADSRLRHAVRWLFGRNQPTGLANPRLESLRRLIVWLRHGTAERAANEIRSACEAGFTALQIDLLARRFARRGRSPNLDRASN